MEQLQIKFFWPLTEQIPLELDYTDCAKPKLSVTNTSHSTLHLGDCSNITFSSTVRAAAIEVTQDNVSFSGFEMPWYRKALFKLMGFKWK